MIELCDDCKGKVSNRALVCVHCGCPFDRRSVREKVAQGFSSSGTFFIIFVTIPIILFFLLHR